jgi:hypothetical protein
LDSFHENFAEVITPNLKPCLTLMFDKMMQDLAQANPPEAFASLSLLSVMFPEISAIILHIVNIIFATPWLGFVKNIIDKSISTCPEQRLRYALQGGTR